jgi:hypothetical protein
MFPAWPANLACTCPRAYLGEEALAWLTTDWVLGQFGATVGVARRRYAQFIEAGRSEGHSEVFYGGVADSRVVEEEDFVQAMLKRPRREKPPRLTAIEAYVCEQYALTRQALRAEGRCRLRRARSSPGLPSRARPVRWRTSLVTSAGISPHSAMRFRAWKNARETPPVSPALLTSIFMQ